jgi:hypothetical protein
LFEDLSQHKASATFVQRVEAGTEVANRGGKIQTSRLIRRNDSICGAPPAGLLSLKSISGFSVKDGPVAEPHIGCEVKILAKSQTKQIDRVINDLEGFASRMRRLHQHCINIAIVGVNHESDYVSYEGNRSFKHELGQDEADHTHDRLRVLSDVYDEVLVLPFEATNQPPYPFGWVYPTSAKLDYGAILTRVGAEYERRFR